MSAGEFFGWAAVVLTAFAGAAYLITALSFRVVAWFLRFMDLAVQLVPRQPDKPSESEQTASGGPGGLMTGKCRGCGLVHVGLTPAAIERVPGGYDIANGTPAVCPRCWVKMNPDMATNVVSTEQLGYEKTMFGPNPAFNNGGEKPQPSNRSPVEPEADQKLPRPPSHRSSGYPAVGGEGAPEVTDDQIRDAMEPRKDYEKPDGPEREHLPDGDREGFTAEMDFEKPPTEADNDKGMTDEELEAATKPEKEHQCSQCQRQTGPMKPDRDGKLWCVQCIDALGGPGNPTRKRRRGK